MTAIDSAGLKKMFDEISTAIEAERDHLCVLDGAIGDADHGIAMALGFGAVRDALAGLDLSAAVPTTLFNIAAKSFLNAVGASSGPLYATAFMRAAAAVKGKAALDEADAVAMLQAMAKGIAERGKAVVGEKTMVDAWLPAAEAAGCGAECGKGPGGEPGSGGGCGPQRRRNHEIHGRHQGSLGTSRRSLAGPHRSGRSLGRNRHRGDAQGAERLIPRLAWRPVRTPPRRAGECRCSRPPARPRGR